MPEENESAWSSITIYFFLTKYWVAWTEQVCSSCYLENQAYQGYIVNTHPIASCSS